MDFYLEWFPHLLLLSVASPFAPEFESGGRSGFRSRGPFAIRRLITFKVFGHSDFPSKPRLLAIDFRTGVFRHDRPLIPRRPTDLRR